MNEPRRLRWTQLSMRGFLAATLLLGLLLGVAGPPVYRWLREQWTKKPPVDRVDMMAAPTPLSITPSGEMSSEQWSVYESSETPLD